MVGMQSSEADICFKLLGQDCQMMVLKEVAGRRSVTWAYNPVQQYQSASQVWPAMVHTIHSGEVHDVVGEVHDFAISS